MKTDVIINPASAGGTTRRLIPLMVEKIQERLGEVHRLCVTEKPLDAFHMARRAADEGCERLIVAGGDGTLHEAVNGLASGGLRTSKRCTLGVIASGSGNGLAQSLGLPASLEEQIDVAAAGQVKKIDLARLVARSLDGMVVEQYFINECQIGIGATVVKQVGSRQKRIGGLLAYGLGTLAAIVGHPNQEMDIRFVDGRHLTEPLAGLSIGNGSRTAAGMQLTPDAELDDGLLDVLVIHGQSAIRRFLSFPKIYTGSHREDSGFSYFQTAGVEITSSESVLLAADGELIGTVPCSIDLIAGALSVCAPHSPAEENHATCTEQLAEG